MLDLTNKIQIMPLFSQRNQWHVIYQEEFHDLLYQRPFEDQLV